MSATDMSTRSALIPTYATYPFELVEGEGVYVRDREGRAYLDFYGGHAVAALGHSPREIVAAISGQASEFLFYSNVARIPVRDQAARALVDFAGPPFAQVFFCNSGTEANEAALKVAMQTTGRRRIAALSGAFHGRTLLSLSATDGEHYCAGMESLLVPTERLAPNQPADLARLDDTMAAVIVEPIQSMAGVVTLEKPYLEALRRRTQELGIVLVFDEVQTGMARLGAPFAATRFGVTPDLITSAKALGGGVPVGAVIFSEQLASQVKEGDLGSTFGGGPLASAAVLAMVTAIRDRGIEAQVRRVSDYARKSLAVGPVSGVRGDGWLMGLETTVPAKQVHKFLLERGILTGTSGDPRVLRLLPPLIIEEKHVDQLRTALLDWKGGLS